MDITKQIETLRNLVKETPETEEDIYLRELAMQMLTSYGIFA